MIKDIKVAVVAPQTFRGDDEYRNVERASAYVTEAAEHDAHLVCFPEAYPGPSSGPMNSGGLLPTTPTEAMCQLAIRHSLYISCGNLEESEEIPDAYYLTHKLISPKGEIMANYKRCQPTPPPLNARLYGGRMHLLPGNELMVVDTELGKIGLIICSELWVPELSRIETLMGAEVIIAPIGGSFRKSPILSHDLDHLSPWQCIARARAAENMVYVITTSNVFFADQPWGTFIAGPEGTLAVSPGVGISYATLDMERLRYLRSTNINEEYLNQPLDSSKYRPICTSPGMNRERRPALYTKLVEHQPNAYDYFYYKSEMDTKREGRGSTSKPR